MWMGTDGCDGMWVTQGDTKTRQTEPKNDRSDHFCDAMAGEISPDIMFCEIRLKWKQMVVDGCRLIRMGVDGCISKGGSKNNAKRGTSSRAGRVFDT